MASENKQGVFYFSRTDIFRQLDSSYGLIKSRNNSIQILDLATKKTLRTIKPEGVATATLLGGSYLALVLTSGMIELQNLVTGNISKFTSYIGQPVKLSITPDHEYLIAKFSDEIVTIWNIKTKTLVNTIRLKRIDQAYRAHARSVMLSPDTRWLAVGLGNFLGIYNTRTGELVQRFEDKFAIDTVTITPDSLYIINRTGMGTAYVRSLITGETISLFSNVKSITCIEAGDDDFHLLIHFHNDTAKLWNFTRREFVYNFQDLALISCITTTPNNDRIITGLQDGSIKIWGTDLSSLRMDQLLLLAVLIQIRQQKRLEKLPFWFLQELKLLPDPIKKSLADDVKILISTPEVPGIAK